jgi:type I restriction-modification system DNA methylase subunit
VPVEVKPLFRADILRPRLQHFSVPNQFEQHRQLVQKWATLLGSPRADSLKEQELLADFLSDIFTGILGYSKPADNPSLYTISREQHLPVDGKFADAVLGHFTPDRKQYIIALEGKGPTDPLDRPFKNRKMSAVDQGYRYAINLPCDWIIVTSMRETRLYYKGADQLTYERFRLADLAASDLILKRFIYLLGAERVVPTTGPNHLDTLRSASDKFDRELTKEYYLRYANMREDIYEQLCAANPSITRHDILSATQKALDRVLFAAFCEDRGLLPEHTLKQAFEHRDLYNPRPIWENFKGLFRSIDIGNDSLKIPAYNGGLFAIDNILDNLLVPDAVCNHFKELGEYSYRPPLAADDLYEDNPASKDDIRIVDVDILGHIFEQSITDLEQIRNELDGLIEPQGKEKHQTRRKKEGAFYTPAFITRYILEQTLGTVLQDRFETLRQSHAQKANKSATKTLEDPRIYDLDTLKKPQRDALVRFWEAWQDELETIRILDPACGSGAFLIEAFDQLHAAYQRSNDRLEEIRGHRTLFDLDSKILQHNLYGVDLNEEAIDIGRLSLWIKTAQRGKPLTSLDHTLRVGNSVVNDPNVHPLALNWQNAFPEVITDGGFDVVIGNPPYIRQEWIKPYKEHWQSKYKSFASTADIYVYFYEQGMKLLRPGGRLSYIVTNKWLKADYGEPLRRFFAEDTWIESIVDFGHAKQIFPDADVFPCIIVARRPLQKKNSDTTRICAIPREQLRVTDLSNQIRDEGFCVEASYLSESPWQLEDPAINALLSRIQQTDTKLKEFIRQVPRRGTMTGYNSAFFITEDERRSILSRHSSAEKMIHPYLRGQDIDRWGTGFNQWMIVSKSSNDHPWPWSNCETEEAAEEMLSQHFPSLYEHFKRHEIGLRQRANKVRFWWELSPCTFWSDFERTKIVYQEIQFHPWYAIDSTGMYANNKCFIIPTDDLYLLSVLNSPLMWWHNFRYLPHMKDEALSPVGFLMESLPIAQPTATIRNQVESRAAKLITITDSQRTTRNAFLDWLKVEYNIDKPTQKLANPIHLDSDAIVAEVKKIRGKKNPLSAAALKALRDEDRTTLAPARQLAAEAATLEQQLSDLVNQAYQLTPEEIALMWKTAPPRMPIAPPTSTPQN